MTLLPCLILRLVPVLSQLVPLLLRKTRIAGKANMRERMIRPHWDSVGTGAAKQGCKLREPFFSDTPLTRRSQSTVCGPVTPAGTVTSRQTHQLLPATIGPSPHQVK